MKKTLKAMISVLMAAVISVTSLCTMASAVKNGDTCVDSEGRDSVYYDGIWYYKPVEGVWYNGVWYAAQIDEDEPLERNFTLSPMKVNVPVAERKPVTTHGITFKNTTLDWAKSLNLPLERTYLRNMRDFSGAYCEPYSYVPYTEEEELILRNALCRIESLEEYNASNDVPTTLTHDDVLAYFEYRTLSPKEYKYASATGVPDASALHGERIISYNNKYDGKWHYDWRAIIAVYAPTTCFNISDVAYYAEHIAGYSRAQVESMYKSRAIKYFVSEGIPKSEATKYWDRSISCNPTIDGLNRTVRLTSLKTGMIYFDLAGRAFTKKEIINGKLPTGAVNTLSAGAQKLFKANPSLQKIAILDKLFEESYGDAEEFTLTASESKKLKTLLSGIKGNNDEAVKEYDVPGVSWCERNTVIPKLYYLYPNMTADQKKVLNSYANSILKKRGISTSYAKAFPVGETDFDASVGSSTSVSEPDKPTTPVVEETEADKKMAEVENLLIQVAEGLTSGTVEMTSAQYSSLKSLYTRVGFTPSDTSKYSKNTKLALIEKFMDALPTMTSAQLTSLRVQLKSVLA